RKIPIPVNFNTIDIVFQDDKARIFKENLLYEFGPNKKVPVLDLMKSSNIYVKEFAIWVYEKIFVNYTAKQWGKKPHEIDPSVTARVPIYTGYDNRYFHDKYQFIPIDGYTSVFKKLLSNSLIEVKLNTDFRELIKIDFDKKEIYLNGIKFDGIFIFTGMIDELCNYVYGELPYRTLDFEFKTFDVNFFQEAAIVNYPNDFNYTRITEFKHIHPSYTEKTTVAFEYPRKYKVGDIPYYPYFTDEAKNIYLKYREFIKDFNQIILVGRLAEYRYYDMDDAIKRSLEVFNVDINI
ncbi:MAG: UDP-galactopyranose mutase, partial [Candidatus Goldbacteria bacterium]|nr:UDP-galactopyranose mutase [Candidatus Goldiibacteriota bacterium]